VKKSIVILFNLALSYNVFSQSVIDVYGSDSITANEIINKYRSKIDDSAYMLDKAIKSMGDAGIPMSSKQYELNKMKLEKEIKRKYGFLFVELDTIYYSDKKNIYTTVEVVEKKHAERLRFVVAKNNNKFIYKSKNDLINEMITYEKIGLKLGISQQLDPKSEICPVYHCTEGFSHPKLKPYLKIFNVGAIRERELILNTLSKDPSSSRRGAAAFLVGHFRDPHEILTILSPYVNDKDEGVRNDVMRVMGETIKKAKITKIDVLPFVNLLSSPYDTDRNKALFVLREASKYRENINEIIQYGNIKLMDNLKLKQPNNHDFSYQILKLISNKNYSEYDLKNWGSWLSHQKNEIADSHKKIS